MGLQLPKKESHSGQKVDAPASPTVALTESEEVKPPPSAFADEEEATAKVAEEIAVFRVAESTEKPSPKNKQKPSAGSAQKPSAGKGRKFNPAKPPAIKGFKWSPNGSGFDCRAFTETNGKTVESFVGYLGKKKLAEFRDKASTQAELRELVRAWAFTKLARKGQPT